MFDFGKANPTTDQSTADKVGNAGTLISDAGSVLPAPVGGGAGFIGNMMVGASELSQGEISAGIGDLGAGVLGGAAAIPAIAQHVPGLGVAAGLSAAIGHAGEAMKHTDEINKGYRNNQFWTEAGWATMGGLNAAAALDPTGTSSLVVGGAGLLLDGLGTVAGAIGGQDYAFDAGSVVGGAEHLAFDTGQAIASGASSALHGAEHIASDAGGAISNGWHHLLGHDATSTSGGTSSVPSR